MDASKSPQGVPRDRLEQSPVCAVLIAALAILATAWLGSYAGSSENDSIRAEKSANSADAGMVEEGERLFRVSCASCNGTDARGNGPVAPILAVPVPDLTLIAARRGGSFPADEVYRIVDGQADLSAHGPRHMPVWGYEFFGEDADDETAHRTATEKIDRVVPFLHSVQRNQ
jgi:mono/diheme cytochrome c family protein